MKPSSNPFSFSGAYRLRRRRLHDYDGKQWGYESDPVSAAPPPPASLRQRSRRLFGFIILAGISLTLLASRLVGLQLFRGEELRAAAEQNRIRLQPIPARRGIVYDSKGRLLVRNVPNETLQLIPADLPRHDDLRVLAEKLAPILHEDAALLAEELRTKRSFSYQSILLREHLSYDTAIKIRLIENSIPGLVVRDTATRLYLAGEAIAPVLGYTGKISENELQSSLKKQYQLTDQIGKSGLELSYESVLRGKDGREQIEVDALGKEKRVIASAPPRQGANLHISLDTALQQKAADALQSMMKSSRATGGALVALDPRNGNVLALATAPSYDNNIFSDALQKDAYERLLKDPRNPFFFRPIAGQYPSGSTIKPLIAALALHDKIITEKTTVLSSGGIRIGQWFFPDWKAGGHGITDVRKAIADSVNTFFYTVGGGTDTFTGLGVERLAAELPTFGLGRATGIDLRGEAQGLLPTPAWKEATKKEPWYIGDTYHFAIGQGDLLVTPLQMAVATAAIANGGTAYRPRLVTSIEEETGNRTLVDVEKISPSVADPGAIRIVREGMRQAVVSGSSQGMQALPVASAGKTGTAQFGSGDASHSWFTAFAPYESPEIAVAVVLEGGGEGHLAALPVAREVLSWYFSQGIKR